MPCLQAHLLTVADGRDGGYTKLLLDDSPEAHRHGKILGGGTVGHGGLGRNRSSCVDAASGRYSASVRKFHADIERLSELAKGSRSELH